MINGLRFIIGSGCNYNCFFCHHEGYTKDSYDVVDKDKIYKLYQYAKENNIKDISITGGEPFLYWNKLRYLLSLFTNGDFRITLNTNLSLADRYFDKIKDYSNIEYHVNFSSLNNEKHKSIISKEYLDKVKNNLELFKSTKSKVCLNIPVLNGINKDEMLDIYNYAGSMGFKARFLVLYPMNKSQYEYFFDVDEIMKIFPNAILLRKYSYGRYDIASDIGDFEIVKCLCTDKECDLCRETTYLHITPDLNLKICMIENEEFEVDYTDKETIGKSFQKTIGRLKQ